MFFSDQLGAPKLRERHTARARRFPLVPGIGKKNKNRATVHLYVYPRINTCCYFVFFLFFISYIICSVFFFIIFYCYIFPIIIFPVSAKSFGNYRPVYVLCVIIIYVPPALLFCISNKLTSRGLGYREASINIAHSRWSNGCRFSPTAAALHRARVSSVNFSPNFSEETAALAIIINM